MRNAIPATLLVAAISVASAAAESQTFSLAKVHFEGWAAEGPVKKVAGKKLYDLIDGLADIHMGFSYRDSEHLALRKGKREIEIAVFRENSPENAYGLYTCLRERDGELVPVADEASFSYGTLVAWRGPYCIQVQDVGEEETPKRDLIETAGAISRAIGGAPAKPPRLVRALPRRGLARGTILYFHHRHPLDQVYYLGTKDVLLLGTDATKPSRTEAVFADYKTPRGKQSILVVRYPDASRAAKALSLYVASLRSKGASAARENPPWRVFASKDGKATVVFRKGRLLAIAPDSVQPETARSIIEKTVENLAPQKAPKPPRG